MSTTNQTLTQAEAQRAMLGIAITQTAYALNNGGGIVTGQPLTYIDDQTTGGRAGYTPLNLSIPNGFIVQKIYNDTSAPSENTGANMFMAYNPMTKEVLLGMAGTNGVGHDMPDTRSDLSYVGADQARYLATKTTLGTDIAKNGVRSCIQANSRVRGSAGYEGLVIKHFRSFSGFLLLIYLVEIFEFTINNIAACACNTRSTGRFDTEKCRSGLDDGLAVTRAVCISE